ncbi:Hin recombinase [Microbacteriaceae bacterium VKM Ac-2855]|nr:Hin recombinase [Microbacteriaceae bacterium VKM Ac-2855]
MTAPHAPLQNDRNSSGSANVLEFSVSELREAQARRNERGQKMTPSRIAQARAMHASGRYTILQIAEVLGVSRSTVHRHLG